MEFAPEGPMALPLWINGRAYLTVGDRFYDVFNPASGEAVRRIPLCGATEAAEAVVAAQAAQAAWAARGIAERRQLLAALATGLESYAGHFAKLLDLDRAVGAEAAAQEVAAAVDALRGEAVGASGVCALVVGASRPLARFAAALAPAVLAGATVVVKPSPKAPSAAFALCELSARAAWPAGVLNLLQGDTAAIEGLCAAAVDRLVYAGEQPLGDQVGAIASAVGVPFETAAA